MSGALAGEHQLRGRLVTLLALGALILALSQQLAPSEAHAAPTDYSTIGEDRLGPYFQRYLVLSVPADLKVGRPATVQVEGFARAGEQLTVFVDPKGRECPASASARPADAISLVDDVTSEGVFRVEATYRPQRHGKRSFCAYLTASSADVDLRAGEERVVIARRLRAAVARRTVATALKRHGFARRVVKSVDRDCRRRSRSVFACKFSAGFPGYRLKGKGQVRLGIDLSYRFRVKAQGVRFTLTDENEERRSN